MTIKGEFREVTIDDVTYRIGMRVYSTISAYLYDYDEAGVSSVLLNEIRYINGRIEGIEYRYPMDKTIDLKSSHTWINKDDYRKFLESKRNELV